MIRLMIVDDHPLMRRLVRELLSQEHDMELVAEACNGSEAETLATQTQPDVVLMAQDLPDGFEATQRIKTCSPPSRIIIMIASLGQDLFLVLKSGAVGYITKDSEPETFIQAIRSAFRGDLYLPHDIACHVIAQVHALVPLRDAYLCGINHEAQQSQKGQLGYQGEQERQASSGTRPLSEREQEILSLIRRGRKNGEIAGELHIAVSTVHKHVQNIFEKLHARNRAEAIYLTSGAN